MGVFLGFLPWIVFWVLSGRENYQIAAAASVVVVIFLCIRDIQKRNIKVLDVGTLLFFVFLTLIAYTSEAVWIDTHATPLSTAALFLIALTSILIRKPFTLQYAREQVDPKFWDSPRFYSTNLTISWVWCFAFAIMAVTSYVALNHPSLIDRVIHILAFVGAIKFTAWYPDYVKKKLKNESQNQG
ncbi:MAG: hypothetical protein U9M96_04280 [Thermodesulfobacteriota bacterium]|nr:hypothetical protein [Thermodesulfobacteriota bacterium]